MQTGPRTAALGLCQTVEATMIRGSITHIMTNGMKHLWLLGFVLSVLGCATAEKGRSISTQDVTWIQKGKTSRAEVVQRFGGPTSETPDWAAMHYQVTSITTTTKPGSNQDGESQQSVTTTTMEPIKPRTKAVYVHEKTEGGVFVGIQITEDHFWVTYDENGVVQDFGLQAGPGTTVR